MRPARFLLVPFLSCTCRTGRWGDTKVVLVSLFLWWTLGVSGGALLAAACTPSWFFLTSESVSLVYRIRWGALLLGGLPGFYLSAVVLGRYLRNVSPWIVLGGIMVFCSLMVLIVTPKMVSTNDGLWLRAVGLTNMVGGHAVRILGIAAIMSLGIWLGQKRRVSIESMKSRGSTATPNGGLQQGPATPDRRLEPNDEDD